MTGCRRELAQVYAAARHGGMEWEQAACAADILRLIVSLLVTGRSAAENDHGANK